jgi:hypothetical protein
VTGTPFQSFYLPQKLRGECGFAPEPLIAGFAPQALVHVARSRLKRAPEDAQLLFIQFEQHHAPRACRSWQPESYLQRIITLNAFA